MKKFKVTVVRVLTSHKDIFVDAENFLDAQTKAYKKAEGLEFENYPDSQFSPNPTYKLGNIQENPKINAQVLFPLDRYHIDTDRVGQYEGMRIVDEVTIVERPKNTAKKVLVYSTKLKANVLVFINDLRS